MLTDEKLIDHLEDLSYLTLTADEKKRITGDLNRILGYMERLGELNTEDFSEQDRLFDNVNDLRKDEAGMSFDRKLILKNAPDKNTEVFIVPKTVE